MQLNRNGFLYVLDRANGELISRRTRIEQVNWASHIDKETGRPSRPKSQRSCAPAGRVEMWPIDARRQELAARRVQPGDRPPLCQHDPRRRGCSAGFRRSPYKPGQRYHVRGESPDQAIERRADRPCRRDRTVDRQAASGASRSIGSPALGGDSWRPAAALLFTGKETGEFVALDADNGKTVWQFQTGSGINAMPITYTYKGRQYVTVLSGLGGVYANQARDRAQERAARADRCGLSR